MNPREVLNVTVKSRKSKLRLANSVAASGRMPRTKQQRGAAVAARPAPWSFVLGERRKMPIIHWCLRQTVRLAWL